jgi:hypothetical protein
MAVTDEEKHAILDKIDELVADLREDGPDAADGKVVWPPDGNMSHKDALATLFDIADCDLSLTLYDDTGNALTDELTVTFSGTQLYPNSPGHYARKPLKAMIEEELALYIAEDASDYPGARLLKRLLLAFEEPV